MNLTTENLTPTVGTRADELVSTVTGTIYNLRKQHFLKWSIPRVHPRALIEMTLANTIASMSADDYLPIPAGVDIVPYVNAAAAEVFAEWRAWYELDSKGQSRAKPRDPQVEVGRYYNAFDWYRPDQFLMSGVPQPDDEISDRTAQVLVLMALRLSDEQIDMLTMLGNGMSQEAVAAEMGFVFNPDRPTRSGRSFVQSKLVTIRRQLCGEGVVTQTQAGEWLAALTNTTSVGT